MTFVVKIIENPSQLNCFGYLLRTPTTTPSSHAFGVFHCTQIHANNPATFVIQVFGEQSPFSFIQFHPIFAHVLGVAAGDELVLEPVSQIPTCTSMEIYPETYEDWNVIETTAVVIEDLFLDQIRIVSTGMQFVLFVAQNVAVKFRVLSTTPADAPEGAVIASNMTEVLVAPRVQSKKTPIHGSINSQSGPPRSFADKIGDSAKSTILNQFTCPEERSRVLRILSTDLVDFDFQHLKFGNQNYIIALNEERSSMIRKSLVNIGKPSNQFLFLIELPQSSCNEYIQEVINLLQKYPGHCITSSPELHQFIECTTIKINYLTPSDVTVVRELYVSDESALDIDGDASDIDLKAIRNVLYQNFNSDDVYLPVIVPEDGIFVDLPVDGTTKSFRLESRHSHDNCNIFWPDSMPNITAVYPNDDTVASKRPKPSENVESAVSFTNFGTLNFSKSALRNQVDQIVAVYNEITTSSESKLEYRALITGHHGSGRSTLLKLIANHSFLENCVFSVYINCNGWKSKSVETVQKQLSDALKFVQKRKPSILFLDNIDFLNVNLDDEDRSKFVAKVYYYIAKALFSTPDVSIVATAKSIHDLPPALLAVDSKRLFDSVFEVVSLNQDDKMAVLKQLLGDDRWPLDLRLTSEEITTIEGLTLGDLVKLAERTHLNLRANGSADFKEGLSEAIAATPSAGKRIVKRSDVKEIDFGDVGGLEEVKQKLREVFIWPSKYAVLFGKCGLRLGGGAVLHGPSGCGKTLLARAIGAESALNVISVKGPELLSKYIGASEQNVRELFEKARQTKPSLIIFDEFDALAPKRGHDSTGVTDRVVNQLLTELDGIDSANEGVYVLAATNRMDLIDNALLRPGRFDHKIRVDLPSESDRADTLRVLCREVENVANDVDFDALAKQTDGYTGADLRGLVLTAQFEAIDEASNSDETPTITMKQLQNALSQRKSKSNKQQTREVGHTGAGTRVTLA